MKLTPDDPRLTAYLLGELPAEEAAQVEQAAGQDEEIRAELQRLSATRDLLAGHLPPASDLALSEEQVHAILARAKQPSPDAPLPAARSSSGKKGWEPWLIPLSFAAVLTLALLILARPPQEKPLARTGNAPAVPSAPVAPQAEILARKTAPAGPLPAAGPFDHSSALAADALVPRMRSAASSSLADPPPSDTSAADAAVMSSAAPSPLRGSVPATAHPSLPLPVEAGRTNLAEISRTIREQRRFPDPGEVRLEELLNSFALRPTGPSAIAKGVTLSTESVACPWKPSATLLLVSFRGAAAEAHHIAASYQADPATVFRYRLLGYRRALAQPQESLPSLLPAQTITTLAIEIEPTAAEGPLGAIAWSVDGSGAAELPVHRPGDNEPSDDARFATLLCTFGEWLSGNQQGVIDAELVAALARENASDTLPPDRADFLNLIDQALNR